MPIISNFPGGSGTGGGVALAAVSNISVLVSSGQVHVSWTDPSDIEVDGTTYAEWAGTLLVRKAGSMPASRRDGTIVLDSVVRDAYSSSYFTESGLTDGVTYYYKFYPYTTDGVYTDSEDDEFTATPTAEVDGIDEWLVTGISLTKISSTSFTVTWTDPSATITSNDVTLATWYSTTVVISTDDYVSSVSDTTNVVASYTNISWCAYSSSGLEFSDFDTNTTYYVALFPQTTDGYVNSDESQRASIVLNRETISAPSYSGTLTYTGLEQSPTWDGYDSSTMTIGGVTSATDAGTYITTFTPNEDYEWEDYTQDTIEVEWTIEKATGSLSLSVTSLELDVSNLTDTIIVTRSGDGAISATSSDTGVATVSLSETTITVTAVASGTATITVSVAASTNYKAPSSQTCSVTVNLISATLDENAPSVIQEVAQNGLASAYWSVGDMIGIELNGTVGVYTFDSETYYAYIIGFDHNSDIEGTNTIHFQMAMDSDGTSIAFVDSSYGSSSTSDCFHINSSNTNSGGWESSYMRSTICPAFLSVMPSDWQSVISACTKYTDNTGEGSGSESSYVTTTSDEIWLLAALEVSGSTSNANLYEAYYQEQYEYYSNGNSKIKYKHSDTSTACAWWLRSPGASNSIGFYVMAASGSLFYVSASISRGFAPGFMVA